MRLFKAIPIVVFLAASTILFAQSKKPLTNQDVVHMVKAGFDNQTVIKAIQANQTNFDVSPEALLALKNSGVNQTIIQAMLSRTTAEQNSPVSATSGPSRRQLPPPAANPNDPMSSHAPGIYWESTVGQSPRMLVLQPSNYSQGKMTGTFGMAMSMGISKSKWKVVVGGPRASLRIPASQPEFWFYFANSGGSFGSGPSTPSDFTLVKLERHGSDRELVVGKGGVFGVSSGVSSKDAIALSSKQVSPGIYEAVPEKALRPGEYAFLPAGQGGMVLSMTGGKLFDFGVDSSH